MLQNQNTEKLRALRLPAMAGEYERQRETPDMAALDFDDRLGMMIDAEWTSRNNNRVKKLLTAANLRVSTACFADIDYKPSRRLDKGYVARLSDFAWAKSARNLIITGCTGTGKTWLACAFGAEACRRGLSVGYYRMNRLLGELNVAAGDGSMEKLLKKLRKTNILILDDWGLSSVSPAGGRHILEVVEDRNGESATILAAQLPVTKWHELFEDSTVADAVLDRLVHNSYRFELQGPSMRRLDAAGARKPPDQTSQLDDLVHDEVV